jgi:hypothetical protein
VGSFLVWRIDAYSVSVLPGKPGDRTRSQQSGTRFPYTGMRMELDHKKLNVY